MVLQLALGEPTDINHGSKDRSKSSFSSIIEIASRVPSAAPYIYKHTMIQRELLLVNINGMLKIFQDVVIYYILIYIYCET